MRLRKTYFYKEIKGRISETSEVYTYFFQIHEDQKKHTL